MMFLLLAVGYAMRVNLSVAIVAMLDKENKQSDNPDVPVRFSKYKKTINYFSNIFLGVRLVKKKGHYLVFLFHGVYNIASYGR